MLNNCKISRYKIKKILKTFVKDATAADASNMLKVNIKTINRYYNLFRQVILQVGIEELKNEHKKVNYIGWVKGTYGDKCYFKIYKSDEKTFYSTKSLGRPSGNCYAVKDNDFAEYLSFIHKRLAKFHGLSVKSYYYQLFESMIKYKYSEECVFSMIWKSLKDKSKKEKQ